MRAVARVARRAAAGAWSSSLTRSVAGIVPPLAGDVSSPLMNLRTATAVSRSGRKLGSSVLPLPTALHGRPLWTSTAISSKLSGSGTDTVAPVSHKVAAPSAIVKSGCMPVLRFDEQGDGELLEMSRSAVLQITQEAAMPVENDVDDPPDSDNRTSAGADRGHDDSSHGRSAPRDSAGRRNGIRDGSAVELQVRLTNWQ